MESERMVAGLRCGEVLADLSDYLDGTLTAQRRAQIDEHLRGCTTCERFGGEFSAAIAALRRNLAEAQPLNHDVADRLRERLRQDLD
jgi:anti-sigma factor RsiW